MDNKEKERGFSGLSDLASEISEVFDALGSELSSEATSSAATMASSSTPEAAPHSESEQKSTTSHSPAESVDSGNNASGSAWKWILGVVAVLFVIWLANHGGQTSKKTSYNPYPPTRTYNFSQSNPAHVTTPSTSRDPGHLYEKPPIGTNHVHSVPQIRWCVRESIRIETMRHLINSNEGVDEFNKIVDDYNRRCGSYRYHRGSLERARREVEAYRSQIVAEAIRDAGMLGHAYRLASPSSPNRKSAGSAPKRPNAQLTREAQKLLIELGYEPGPIDGQYGPRTAAAIRAFQKDAGITQDGWIDENLINSLIKAKAALNPAISAPSP